VLYGALKKLGLSDRFEMHELSPRCTDEFTGIFETFCERISNKPSTECQRSVD
jgi:hypothetical protein